MLKAPIKTAADSKNWYLEFWGKQDLIFQQMIHKQYQVLFSVNKAWNKIKMFAANFCHAFKG